MEVGHHRKPAPFYFFEHHDRTALGLTLQFRHDRCDLVGWIHFLRDGQQILRVILLDEVEVTS